MQNLETRRWSLRRDPPTHAQLCVLTRQLLEREPELADDQGELEEQVKRTCARLALAYDSECVRKAADAVLYVRRKRSRYHRVEGTAAKPPVPWCLHPEICTPKGYCRHDPACND